MTDPDKHSLDTGSLGPGDYLPYILPFMVFAGFTYAVPVFGLSAMIVYPAKTLTVFACIVLIWPKIKTEIVPVLDLNAVLAGIFAFILWIGLEGRYPLLGSPEGSNPLAGDYGAKEAWGFIGARLVGAVLIVPVMEEVFWRSFALRFLVDKRFIGVPLGTFSWFSFIGVSVAFGLEHHRWLPGILTGMLYALVLYQKKNLFSPILAHSVTNLLLGLYVVINGAWEFW